MDFLTLCKRLRQEARIAGTGPASTSDQTGEAARIVTWINNAWTDIQRASNQWLWMKNDFSASTVINQTDYPNSELSINESVREFDKESFTIYGTSNGVADETEVFYLPWPTWKRLYALGTQTASRPIHWTQKPDKTVCIGPKPEKAYTLKGWYWTAASELSGDGASPSMPEEYHLLIVWWALTKYGASEAAPEVFAHAEAERVRLLAELRLTQLPDMELSGPLE